MGSELWQDRNYVRINESWSMKNSKMSETIFKEMTESANLIYFYELLLIDIFLITLELDF